VQDTSSKRPPSGQGEPRPRVTWKYDTVRLDRWFPTWKDTAGTAPSPITLLCGLTWLASGKWRHGHLGSNSKPNSHLVEHDQGLPVPAKARACYSPRQADVGSMHKTRGSHNHRWPALQIDRKHRSTPTQGGLSPANRPPPVMDPALHTHFHVTACIHNLFSFFFEECLHPQSCSLESISEWHFPIRATSDIGAKLRVTHMPGHQLATLYYTPPSLSWARLLLAKQCAPVRYFLPRSWLLLFFNSFCRWLVLFF
jgi:hypothetical protein